MTRNRRHAPLLLAMVLLCGCSSLIGGPREPTTIYAPVLEIQPDPAWPAVGWSLDIARPTGAQALDGLRIMVSPTPGTSLMRTLEDSGKIASVSRQGSGASASYRLLLDLRDFRSDYAGNTTPAATISLNAKLLHLPDQAIVGSRSFRIVQPATGIEAAQVSAAFGQALSSLARDVSGWTLETGQAHERQHHP